MTWTIFPHKEKITTTLLTKKDRHRNRKLSTAYNFHKFLNLLANAVIVFPFIFQHLNKLNIHIQKIRA